MLIKDADYGHSNLVSHACDLRVRYGIQESDNRSVIKTKVISYFESEVLGRLNEHITENRKINLYASIKSIYKFESYLDYIQDFTVRCILAKLRISAHNLQIETGRFSENKTPRGERFCPYCKTSDIFKVEDEVHFLVTCPLFNKERQFFFTKNPQIISKYFRVERIQYVHLVNEPRRLYYNKEFRKLLQKVL